MTERPEKCAVCSTAIPPSANQCIGCGAVWGEDNRCPHCHGLSAIRPSETGYACLSCGKARDKKPETTVIGDGPGAGGALAGGDRVIAARGASIGLRLFGITSIAGGVLAAAAVVALFGSGFGGLLAAVAIGGLGVGVGALALRGGSRASAVATRTGAAAREQAIFELAEQKGGVLTVTDLVRELGMSSSDADAAMLALTDGSRVTSELTSDGFVRYVFRELQSLGGAVPSVRARVDADAINEDYEDALEEVEDMLRGGES